MLPIGRLFWRHSGLVFLLFAIGCDGVPQSPAVSGLAPAPSDVVSTSGRGGYDWILNAGEFDMIAPTNVGFVEHVDLQRVTDNLLDLASAQRTTPHKPEGMDDDVYDWFRRYTEPAVKAEPFLTVPFSTDEGRRFDISDDGNRLVVLDKELSIWDLQLSKRTRTLPLPIANPLWVAWDFGAQHLLLMDEMALYRLDAATGAVLASWESVTPLVYVTRAADRPVYALCGKNKKLFVLSEEFRLKADFDGAALVMPEISLRPDGESLLLSLDTGLAQLHVGDGTISHVPSSSNDNNHFLPAAGQRIDYGLTPQSLRAFKHSDGGSNPEMVDRGINPRLVAVCFGRFGDTHEWFTCCVSRVNSERESEFFLQDFDVMNCRESAEVPLGHDPVLEISADRSAEVIAVRDASGLRVFRYQRQDQDGHWTLQRLRGLVVSGRFEQLELAATELRNQRLHPGGRSGESMYAAVALSLGTMWAQCEADGESQESRAALRQFGQWRSSESELAILSSAERHFTNGSRLHHFGISGEFIADDLVRAIDEIERLEKGNDRSLSSLQMELKCGLAMGKPVMQLEPLLKETFERWPDAAVATAIYLKLHPLGGGSPGEAGAYLAALSNLLPKPNGDLLYLRVADQIAKEAGIAALSQNNGGLSTSRLLRSADKLLALKVLGPTEVELLIYIALESKRVELAERLARHHHRHFGLVSAAVVPKARLFIRNTQAAGPAK